MMKISKRTALELTNFIYKEKNDSRIFLLTSNYVNISHYNAKIKVANRKFINTAYDSTEKPILVIGNNSKHCVNIYDDIPTVNGVYRVDLLLKNEAIDVDILEVDNFSNKVDIHIAFGTKITANDKFIYIDPMCNVGDIHACQLFIYDASEECSYMLYDGFTGIPEQVGGFFEKCKNDKMINAIELEKMVVCILDETDKIVRRLHFNYKQYQISIDDSFTITYKDKYSVVIPYEQMVGMPSLVFSKIFKAIRENNLERVINEFFPQNIYYKCD